MPDMVQDDDLQWLRERCSLSSERIKDLASEGSGIVSSAGGAAAEALDRYFTVTAQFIAYTGHVYEMLQSGEYALLGEKELAQINRQLCESILPSEYGHSYANPAYCCRELGNELGQMLSWLFTEVRALVPLAFRDRLSDMAAVQELFLGVLSDIEDGDDSPRTIRDDIYWYISDYADQTIPYRIRETLDPSLSFYRDIIMDAGSGDTAYLYRYGEPVPDDALRVSRYLSGLSQDVIDGMAGTFVSGYLRGFETAGIDLSSKKYVQIRAFTGFERVIRSAVTAFEAAGLECIIFGKAALSISKNPQNAGFGSVSINPQYDFDHSMDRGLYLDSALCERISAQTEAAYEKYDGLARLLAGPALMDVFGQEPFEPAARTENVRLTERQAQQNVRLSAEISDITYRHVDAAGISFTIIAWPLPSIGKDFGSVMKEMIRVNNLDNDMYRRIQQRIIDAMDGADHVRVLGAGKNKTDIRVSLMKITDPASQTVFENCCADVNISLGEVFTSPVLGGTDGVLNVSGVYLGSLYYRDLTIRFRDGFAAELSCSNYEDAEENARFLRQNLLQGHDSLPLGEFAIGTNTTAYSMARRYDISDRLPILIMEKTGPHFALGDTCYSHCEDRAVFNADGREMIARDNEHSLLRKTEPEHAYYNVHTDITIPYDEIGAITAVFADGRETDIIRDGRFCLDGTQELNTALDEGPRSRREKQ